MNKNRKIHIKSLIVLLIIIVLIGVGIAITMSRYQSGAETVLDVNIAFYTVKDTYQEGDIFLENLYPRAAPYNYAFSVTNTDGTNTAETSIEYTVELEVTTNLPLQFSIYKKVNNGSEVELTSSDDIENYVTLDAAGDSYVRKIKIKTGNFTYGQTQTDTYRIAVVFPQEYAEYEEYEGMIDNINIKLDAKQKID